MPINSRAKGAAGELEAAKLLSKYGFKSRRGQQFSGGAESPDVITSIEGFHFEVKRVEALHLYPALDQAARDKGPGELPVVLHRPNKRPWVIIMDAEEFFLLLRKRVNVKS